MFAFCNLKNVCMCRMSTCVVLFFWGRDLEEQEGNRISHLTRFLLTCNIYRLVLWRTTAFLWETSDQCFLGPRLQVLLFNSNYSPCGTWDVCPLTDPLSFLDAMCLFCPLIETCLLHSRGGDWPPSCRGPMFEVEHTPHCTESQKIVQAGRRLWTSPRPTFCPAAEVWPAAHPVEFWVYLQGWRLPLWATCTSEKNLAATSLLPPHQVFICIEEFSPLSLPFSRLISPSSLSLSSYEILQSLNHLSIPLLGPLQRVRVSPALCIAVPTHGSTERCWPTCGSAQAHQELPYSQYPGERC